MTQTSLYKNVSSIPEDLTGGQILAPGEFVEFNDEYPIDDHAQRLIDEGKLVPSLFANLGEVKAAQEAPPVEDEPKGEAEAQNKSPAVPIEAAKVAADAQQKEGSE